ncbi:OmpA family protein [Agrobacterium arsenijevicii]|uniref:Membrane protein n=1 Tax=Agrobacterium arsenijevicii TaxID=1585697 RepID=A0ABR5DC32_9HYPH|nr:membrane protein [Agrobacterium arsenijevicii]
MTNQETATKLEHKGYNRGLILGFTMAESMLLLVFCLLLVAGAIISNERLKATTAVEEAKRLQAQLTEKITQEEVFKAKLEALSSQLSLVDKRKLDEDWRELVEARTAVKQLADTGIETTQIEEVVSSIEILKKFGLDPTKPVELEEKLTALTDAGKSLELLARLEEKLKASEASTTDLAARLADAEKKLIESGASKPHEWPPIISLSEASGYYFRSGSAELTDTFTSNLNGPVATQIADSLKRYGVDIVEVIGHTDEQPLGRGGSNMDNISLDVLSSKASVKQLAPADNAGLGLARAISVSNILRKNPDLAGVKILPLSAAQLVLPGDEISSGQAGNVETRRRIEIRIRRGENATITQTGVTAGQ